MRRWIAFAALLPSLACPSWAAFAMMEVVPSGPAAVPSAALSASPALLAAPLPVSIAAIPALAPAFAAPLLAPELQSSPRLGARDAGEARPPAITALRDAAARSSSATGEVGYVFDAAAPAAPDFETLSPARASQARSRWTPGSALLKPVAAAVNAWNASRHERRVANPRLTERVTTEELGLRETLTGLHAALAAGRYQDAISSVGKYFQTRSAASWYLENPAYAPYRARAFAYMRFAERAVLAAYGRAHARAEDDALLAEARDAALSGRILGHAWRPTAIQEEDSSFCVQNALYNAISASAGFARPVSVADFVAASRTALNRAAELDRPADPRQVSALAHELGLSFGHRDVGQGMGSKSMAEWASILGMTLTSRKPPRGDAGWSGLLRPGREVLLSLRMFHPKYVHSEELAVRRGHDYMTLHHEVYLLGAFDSASRGERFYLVQDSGSGRTLLATAGELSALTQEVQLLSVAGPVLIPQK